MQQLVSNFFVKIVGEVGEFLTGMGLILVSCAQIIGLVHIFGNLCTFIRTCAYFR